MCLSGALTYLFSTGFALNVLALLPHMLEYFDEPDEFSKTCAHNIVQVILQPVYLHITLYLSPFYDLLDYFHLPSVVSNLLDSLCFRFAMVRGTSLI